MLTDTSFLPQTMSKASRSWRAADNDTDSQDTPAPSLSVRRKPTATVHKTM